MNEGQPSKALKKVVFLTNNDSTLNLYDWLKERCWVELCREPLTIEWVRSFEPCLIISYNYSYLIKSDIIDYMHGNIINLHISLLPWNRGASPNFWSFVEDTPKGVTIHQVNSELDKGKILYQKECYLNPAEETFETSYRRLNFEIVELFKRNWKEIEDGKYPLINQTGRGSYHSLKDLNQLKEICPFQWSDNIAEFLEKYSRKVKGRK